MARGPFLVFLDADDWLYPEALEKMLLVWNENRAIAFTDYVGLAFVDDPQKLDPALQQRLYYRNERTQETVIGYRSADFDCIRAQRQPEGERPWIWCNVTALLPKIWHDEVGGFDESMESWEDVDYHYRLARAGKCYQRIPEELMVYRFHTGHRREQGRQAHANLVKYLREKYKEVEPVACSGCAGRRKSVNRTRAPAAGAASAVYARPGRTGPQRAVTSAKDDDFVMVTYVNTQRGDRRLIGPAGFQYEIAPGLMIMLPTDRQWHFNYQYKSGNGTEKFLVHREDQRLKPDWFIPVESAAQVMAPSAPKQAPPPPQRIVEPEVTPEEAAGWPTGAADYVLDKEPAADTPPPVPVFNLQALPGVTPEIAEQLLDAGVTSKEDIFALGVDGLKQFRGVGDVKAGRIIGALTAMDK